MKNRFFARPHPDIELGFRRSLLEYVLTFPKDGINSNTGLILFITGFGDTPDSVYQSEKLRPYLADHYNCIVAGVNYFGMDRKFKSLAFDDYFFGILQAKYGINAAEFRDEKGSIRNDVLQILVEHLKKRGIRIFSEPRPFVQTEYHQKGEYQSFGFLPAIDYLVVLGEILKNYPINKKKIIAYGSSYGGYIAQLLGKFAPHTFSTIIDNAGYSKAVITEICTKDLLASYTIYQEENIKIMAVLDEPWTLVDDTDPYYFSESCRSIRSLLEENHRVASDTSYFIFHGDNDPVCSTTDKEEVVKLLEKYNPTYFKKVTEQDLDGVIFKNMSHGMNASLRGIFDRIYTIDSKKLAKTDEITDFDQDSVYHFDCGKKTYKISFSSDYKVQVQIQ